MFGHRLTLFDLFGFSVRIDASWLLLASLILWSLAAGYFPYVAPGLSPATYWAMGLLGLLGLAVSVVVHELAHAVVARRYRMPISGITLFVFGGVAEMHGEPESPKAEFLMALAGPLMSVAVAGVFHLAEGAVGEDMAVGVVFGYLAFLNLLLAGFNMVPAFPLDGGRVLRALLWAWRGDVLWATRVAAGCGGGFGLALAAWGLLSVLAGNLVGGLWWIVVGLFVRAAANQAMGQAMRRAAGRSPARPVAGLMNPRPVVVPPTLRLDRLVEDYFHVHGHHVYPVVAEGRLLGCVAVAGAWRLPRAEWSLHSVAEVMEDCADATLPDTLDAGDALARMRRSGRSRFMVTHGDRLVGILSLKDLLGKLSLDPS